MALQLIEQEITQPTTAVPTGAVRFVVNATPALTPPVTILIPGFVGSPLALTPVAGGYQYVGTGIPVGSYTAIFAATDTSGPVPQPLLLTVPFALYAAPTLTTQPADPAAAHLPMLAVLEAAPSGDPLQPAALLLVVEAYRGSWVEVGKLRDVCDAATGLARFDLSEYVKTQFSPTPPNESGAPDPALGIRYRVRFGRAASFDGAAGEEQGSFEGLAVNAAQVVNPNLLPLPFPLLNPIPYGGVPTGAARFFSVVTTTGVVNQSTIPISSGVCAARQFVWLHPSGAWAWGFFSGKHEHGLETGDDVVVRRAKGEDYQVGGGDVRDTLRVYSDKVDWITYLHLRTIRRSRRVYERLTSGLYLPVLMEKGSFPEYKETDKLFEVNFTVRYPVLTVQTF